MKRIHEVIIISVIMILAATLRLWQLGAVPISPDWDEAALGYNAYSILKTGRDEYGTFLPLSLRSFNDYKPPLYAYLTVPSVALFGLSVFAVRFPSAVFGMLAVFGTYLLVKTLMKEKSIPYLASFLLAVSPWHIQFSRIAFEANIGVTLNIYGVYFFLRGLYTKSGFIISAILFSLALYAYHSERIFVPLLILLLVFLYRKNLKTKKKEILISLIVGLFLTVPLISVFMNRNALMRLQGTSIVREQTALLSNTINKLEYDKLHGYWLGELFDNRRVEYAKIMTRGYLTHFSPNWLFLTGDHQRHHAPGMGLLYLWELPFVVMGIYWLIRRNETAGKFLISWCLLAPIAATPTTPLPHAVRTLVFLPTFQVFVAIGLWSLYSFVRVYKPIWRIATGIGMSIVITAMFIYYVHMYFVHTNSEYSTYWQYGYKQAVDYAQKHKDEYEKIVVSTDLEQSYMFFLFFSAFDPVAYVSYGGTVSDNIEGAYNYFDRYEFRKIDWPNEKKDGSILYIGTPKEIPCGKKAAIVALDGTPVVHISDRE